MRAEEGDGGIRLGGDDGPDTPFRRPQATRPCCSQATKGGFVSGPLQVWEQLFCV